MLIENLLKILFFDFELIFKTSKNIFSTQTTKLSDTPTQDPSDLNYVQPDKETTRH